MFEVHVSKHSLFRLKITVGCLTSTYPSIHVEDTLKITVGWMTSAYPSIHVKNSEDHGRLPAVHISKHSRWRNSADHGRLPVEHMVQAFAGTCTRAGCGHVHPCWRLCLCLHRRSTAALVWTYYITLTFRALRRNHLVWTPFEAIALTTSPETTKKLLFFVTRESLAGHTERRHTARRQRHRRTGHMWR